MDIVEMNPTRRDVHADAIRAALDGRLPVLANERIYNTFGSFLWTCTAFSAATWAFLIGSNLPIVGRTTTGIIGYLCGMVLGLVPVVLASGLPSYRYGVDPIDASKAAFGVRGIILPLLGALATLVGWTYVLVALTARGLVSLYGAATVGSESHEGLACVLGVLTLIAVWAAALRGPLLFQKLSQFAAPGQMVVTTIILLLLVVHYGARVLWTSDFPADRVLTHDRVRGCAFAVEFGISNALTWWPVMGGLTRLVKHRAHILTPSVTGVGVLGAAFISAVSAVAAARSGTSDPTVWLLSLGGPLLGGLMLGFVLLANLVTMVILIYLAGVSVQQVRALTRVPWGAILALLLAPGIYVAFRTTWMLNVVMNWLSVNGVMFAGITAITFVDYLVLRKQRLSAPHLFSRSRDGAYWYWGGVNWVAVAIAVAATGFYLCLYDPMSMRAAGAFRYLGAGIPTIILSAVAYYVLAKTMISRTGKGGYRGDDATPTAVDL